MGLSNAGNGSGGRLSAIGAVRLRRFRRLPTDPAAPDRLVPKRLAGVLDGLSDAAPTAESAPMADRIPVELDLVELDLGAGAPDTGRHRRPGLSTPEDPTGLISAEMDLGPEVADTEVADTGRHRRSAPPLTSEVPQQGSGSEPPRPTHSKWGARRMLSHMDSSFLT